MKSLIIFLRMVVSMSMIALLALSLLGVMAYYREPMALYFSLSALVTIVVGLVTWPSNESKPEHGWKRI